MTDIDVDKIKTGDRATAYISAWERRFGGGRYVTGTAEVFTRNRVIWVDDPLGGGSVMVRNSDGRLVDGVRIVSHTPADQVELQDAINRTLSRPEVRDALTLLAEPESAWEKARVIRTPKGILCRDPKSGWWIDHEGGQWSSSDVEDMDDVTVVLDADGMNVEAEIEAGMKDSYAADLRDAEERAELNQPSWHDALVVRNDRGFYYGKTLGGWQLLNWRAIDIKAPESELGEVSVVIDAEGRNVEAEAVTHLLRKTEDEKHAAESQIADLIRQRETALRDLRNEQRRNNEQAADALAQFAEWADHLVFKTLPGENQLRHGQVPK